MARSSSLLGAHAVGMILYSRDEKTIDFFSGVSPVDFSAAA